MKLLKYAISLTKGLLLPKNSQKNKVQGLLQSNLPLDKILYKKRFLQRLIPFQKLLLMKEL
jgi:hypothetical protein